MRPSEILAEKRDAVLAVIAQTRFKNPRLFGSVARGEDTDSSDVDMLVDSYEGASLFDLVHLELELIDLLGLQVDLFTPGSLKERIRERARLEEKPL